MKPASHNDPLFKKGLRVRTAVLGAAHTQQRVGDASEYTQAFEEFNTKAAWGLVWSRPGLPRRIRSILNIGMLIALGQPVELKLHMRAALNNGITRKEIAEAVLHSAVYCGIPRATAGRRIMLEVFAEVDAQTKSGAGKKPKIR